MILKQNYNIIIFFYYSRHITSVYLTKLNLFFVITCSFNQHSNLLHNSISSNCRILHFNPRTLRNRTHPYTTRIKQAHTHNTRFYSIDFASGTPTQDNCFSLRVAGVVNKFRYKQLLYQRSKVPAREPTPK